MGGPYGMSFGIFSGTTSIGLACCGCCPNELVATTSMAPARTAFKRFMRSLLFKSWLTERLDAGGDDLLVFMRLHAGGTDAADADSFGHDRQAALHGSNSRHAEHGIAACLDALFPPLRRAARLSRRAPLRDGDACIRRRGAVHACEVQQVAAVVEDGDADIPVVLLRLRLGRGRDLLAVVEGQHGSGLHGCSAFLICSKALGSSMVVRSPGSRPSATAWMERRNVLPERVLGKRVTKYTAFGRAIAPSCLSTVSMTS